jgi:hypothetical protein
MPAMEWRTVILVLVLGALTGCATSGHDWSRIGRSGCFEQTRQTGGESGLVFFCAESP